MLECMNSTSRPVRTAFAFAALAGTIVGCAVGASGAASADTLTPATQAVHADVSHTWEIPPFNTYLSESMECPSTAPYLVDRVFEPWRIIPKGVSVNEPGGVGVIGNTVTAADRYATGVYGMDLSNWTLDVTTAVVTLHCTNDKAESYRR